MTLPGTLTTKRVLGRYHVVCADGLTYSSHTDSLEQAGEWYLEGRGNLEVYDEVEKRYIDPELEIDCVADAYDEWWWGERVWFVRLAHKLGVKNPEWFNWTVEPFTTPAIRKERREREQRNSHHFRRPRWRRALDFTGLT